jgi:hypothetical protein
MWYHCAASCHEDEGPRGPGSLTGSSGGRRSVLGSGRRRSAGGSSASTGSEALPPSTLPKLLRRFDALGTVTVAAPSGGSMVVGVSDGESRPLRLAPSAAGRSSTSRTRTSSGSGGRSFAPVDVIATLTSLPSRLGHVRATIESLRAQTLPPKAIVVAVPRDGLASGGRAGEAKAYAVPPWLLADPSVCVLRTPLDWGPATKLVGLARHLWRQGIGGGGMGGSGGAGSSGGSSHNSSTRDLPGLGRLRLLVVDDDTW